MDNTEHFFAVELEDYAIGIFCTGCKVYFATIEETQDFMHKLQQDRRADQGVIEAFHEFVSGNLEATYVCLGERRLMTPAKQLYQSEFTIGSKVFSLSDELNYPYDYKIAGGIIQHGIFLFDSHYFYAYKAELHDIKQYNPYQKRWELFEDQFWGYPCMIQRKFSEDKKHIITSTSLWLVEKIFDIEAEARNHTNHIEKDPQELELQAFWEDVIGNG